MRFAALTVVGVGLLACRESSSETDAGIDGDGFKYPPPKTGVFPAIGSADTLEIAAWNIENFPASNMTPSRVADLITSLDLDVVMVEEIASETAWQELLERLRDHDGILSEHRYTPTEYQKIGIIYRTGMVTPSAIELLFPQLAYEFPRPPYAARITVDDGLHHPFSYRSIGLHLKAGVAVEDGGRRRAAISQLDNYITAAAADDRFVIAGDYNEVLTTTVGQTNFGPFLTDARYNVRTRAAAIAGQVTFVPSSVMLDHVTTTTALDADFAGANVTIPRLHTIPGYVGDVSDHLPVVLVVPLQPK